MVQRSPTYVMTTKNGWKTVFEEGGQITTALAR